MWSNSTRDPRQLRAEPMLEPERFLDAANSAFGKLRADPNGWREEIRERSLWERTLADGLCSDG